METEEKENVIEILYEGKTESEEFTTCCTGGTTRQ